MPAVESPETAALPIFADCVSCLDCVPLGWRARATPLLEGELHRLHEGNLRALRSEPAEEADIPDPHLLRLHDKLDSLMETVARLLQDQFPPPAARSLRLSHRGLAWTALPEDAPPPGQFCVVELHLHPRLLKPLLLPARVLSVRSAGAEAEIAVEFEQLGDVLVTALERHVFRRHRRALADSRSRKNV